MRSDTCAGMPLMMGDGLAAPAWGAVVSLAALTA